VKFAGACTVLDLPIPQKPILGSGKSGQWRPMSIASALASLFSMTNLLLDNKGIKKAVKMQILDRTALSGTFFHKGRNPVMPVPK